MWRCFEAGVAGATLIDNTWFDPAGNVIKEQPAGSAAFHKTVYDGLGRAIKRFHAYDLDESEYNDAGDVDGDTVMQQTETSFDPAGNLTLSVTRQRFHNATGTGELTNPSGSQPKARVSYVASYPDPLGRTQATADHGTNGGASFTRSATIPTRSDTILVTTTAYDGAGDAYQSIDPMATETREQFDDMGRRTALIQNYKASPSGADESVITQYTYTADGRLETMTALNDSTGAQTTRYVYGTTLEDSGVARSNLLRAEILPDSDDDFDPLGDGIDEIYDRIEYKYNRQGERTLRKDQNETVRAFDYDKLGRQIHDRVIALGDGVDDAVLRLSTVYDSKGRVYKSLSFDNATVGSGAVVNEVRTYYDGFDNPITIYQATTGEVNESTTPKVEYEWASSDNTTRLITMTYPNGSILGWDYDSTGSMADALSRPAGLIFNTDPVVQYQYLGSNTFVTTDYVEPEIRLEVAFGIGDDPYDGFDRFGRIVDHRWYDYGDSADVERIKYGYDRVGNRTWRENTVDPTDSNGELYGYDGLYRLIDFKRGTLNGGHTAISTLTFAQQWTLDETGNWPGFKQDDDGDTTWDLDQSRESNEVNEIVDIAGTTTPPWATPAYDRAGNMISIPQPADLLSSFDGIYDPWNRLVLLKDGADSVLGNAYDSTHRRMIQLSYSTGTLTETRHFYHSLAWQLLEERTDSSSQCDRQYLWGLQYIDDLVLRDRTTTLPLDERIYVLQDANWNTAASTDAHGDIEERVRYDSYGRPSFLNASLEAMPASAVDSTTLYCGYFYLTHIGVYLIRHRVFHPCLGIWIQRDPFDRRSASNPYLYSSSNPLRFTDPSGLEEQERCRCERRRNRDVRQRRRLGRINPWREEIDSGDPDCRMCGPEVFTGLQITLFEVRKRFNLSKDKATKCSLWHLAGTWDITFPDPPQGCGQGACYDSVMVQGRCYDKWKVNYLLFGVISQLCGFSRTKMHGLIWAQKNIRKPLWDGDLEDEYTGDVVGFADVGYDFEATLPLTLPGPTGGWHICKACTSPRSQSPIYRSGFVTTWP